MNKEERKDKTERTERTERPERNSDQKGPRKAPVNRGPRVPVKSKYEERIISVSRVSKTVKGGRKLKFRTLVVIGDEKGNVGFALGKANEVPDAIKKALEQAKRNMSKIELTKNDSIPYEVIGKHGSSKVFMKPAPSGTGVIAGGPVRAVLELAGVKNVYSKVYGSRNSINVVRATIDAIENINKYKIASEHRQVKVEN